MAPRLRVLHENPAPRASTDDPAATWIAPKLLKPWPGNPRKNDPVVPEVVASIQEFGFGTPIVARLATREIIAGHTRWKAAMKLGLERVPVRFLDLSEEKSHKLAVLDNRIGELAEWDMAPLHRLLAEWKVDERIRSVWSDEELRAIEKSARDNETVPDIESVPPPPSVAVTQAGDLWKLGPHRLVCGSALEEKDVALARGALLPWLMVTAPPYGENYDPDWRAKAQSRAKRDPAQAQQRQDWSPAYRLFGGEVAYVWHTALATADVMSGLQSAGLVTKSQIIWAKQHFALGRAAYHWQHEPCVYAVRGDPKWCGDRSQSTLWQIANLNPMGGNKEDSKTNLPTQKPLECMARPMRNHGSAGDVVYEPFCGSGTALVAAEQLDRVCVALEISPAACDVIVERWQQLTGKSARRATM
jgi:DNA modification methylase